MHKDISEYTEYVYIYIYTIYVSIYVYAYDISHKETKPSINE